MLREPFQNVLEGYLSRIVKRICFPILVVVKRANCRIRQQEGFVAGDVQVVTGPKAFFLAGMVSRRADECLYLRIVQQTVQIVVMAQEVLREDRSVLLLPEFGRYRLQLFHEGVGGAVARHREGTIIDDLDRAFERCIQRPRGDGAGRVGRRVVKADFQQDAFLDPGEIFGSDRVAQPDAGAAELGIVVFGIPFDGLESRNLHCGDLFGQPVEILPSSLDVGRFVLVLPGFDVAIGRGLDAQIDIFRETLDDQMPFGEGGSALELKRPTLLLQTPQAVHQPIVFFDQIGGDALSLADLADQIREVGMVVQKSRCFRHGQPTSFAEKRGASWPIHSLQASSPVGLGRKYRVCGAHSTTRIPDLQPGRSGCSAYRPADIRG